MMTIPTTMHRRQLHRTVLICAGVYNLLWGAFTGLYPQWLFEFAEMEPMRYPEVFACLGMVIGLYGVLYLRAAMFPEREWLIVAIGLTGKILGPIGWFMLVARGEWPLSTLILCLTNDLIWWPFFSLYMYDRWRMARGRGAS